MRVPLQFVLAVRFGAAVVVAVAALAATMRGFFVRAAKLCYRLWADGSAAAPPAPAAEVSAYASGAGCPGPHVMI
eukprot:gene7974-24286_t